MKYSCIILAGGEGRRVDRKDKGLLRLDDKPLIQHVIDTISSQVDELIISANRNIDEYNAYGYRVVPDTVDTYRGPMAGIAAALPLCSNEWVLIVPCDMPALPGDLVKRLSIATDHSDICIAESGDRLQLVFLINRKLLPSLEHSLKSNQLKLMSWVRQQNPTIIRFDTVDHFKNFNRTTDFL